MKEEWQPVQGFEGFYEVSKTGKIRSLPRNGTISTKRILKQRDVRGYMQVRLQKNGKSKDAKVHRIVAQAFIENPLNKREVNHKDGNKHNNDVKNLEWATSSENQLHSFYVLGNQLKPVNQLTRDGEFVKAWRCIKEAAKQLKIDASTITNTCRDNRKTAGGFTWQYARKGE